jgi:hypothetical protein
VSRNDYKTLYRAGLPLPESFVPFNLRDDVPPHKSRINLFRGVNGIAMKLKFDICIKRVTIGY